MADEGNLDTKLESYIELSSYNDKVRNLDAMLPRYFGLSLRMANMNN
jgi:hypothetical protein